MKVLVVEDEKKVQKFIVEALKSAEMTVDSVSGEAELASIILTGEYDAIVLDRMLGSFDSLTMLPEIRKQMPKTKVLVLSALSEADDKVCGLMGGADDYLGKPFHISELIARLKAITRRTEASQKASSAGTIVYEDLSIDVEAHKVFRSGKRIELTGKEFRTLLLLAKNPGKVFSKSALLDKIWEINHSPESNVVEVTIANLRSKLDKTFKPIIHSKRGIGYWLGDK